MISHVIRYNATDVPFKQAIFSQNKYPNSKWRYARIADYLNLGGDTEDEKVEKLIAAVEELKRQVDIPNTIQEAIASQGMSDDFFFARVEEMADRAFDDQCTGANPRYPLIEDLKQLLLQAYSNGDTSEVDRQLTVV
jgi:acetaldehyde dehydrogenase / alcohol dehydrogenase